MLRKMTKWSWLAVIALLLVFFGVAAARQQNTGGGNAAKESGKQEKKSKKNSSGETAGQKNMDQYKADPSQYVGSDTCKTCHEEQGKSFDRGPHWKTTLAGHQGPEWQGCEACHG